LGRGSRNNLIAFALLVSDFAIGGGSGLIWGVVAGDLAPSGGVDPTIADSYGFLFNGHLIEFVAIDIRIGKFKIGQISGHTQPTKLRFRLRFSVELAFIL
jgi:hypothetical protein